MSVKIYSLSIHINASDDTPSGEVRWHGLIDEKASRNADIRDCRAALLRAVIETAEAELAGMGEAVLSRDLLAALAAQEAVDDHVAECEDCCDGAFPELCPEGFPIADDARILRRAVLAKAKEEVLRDDRLCTHCNWVQGELDDLRNAFRLLGDNGGL